jgi:hypothetical protein
MVHGVLAIETINSQIDPRDCGLPLMAEPILESLETCDPTTTRARQIKPSTAPHAITTPVNQSNLMVRAIIKEHVQPGTVTIPKMTSAKVSMDRKTDGPQ